MYVHIYINYIVIVGCNKLWVSRQYYTEVNQIIAMLCILYLKLSLFITRNISLVLVVYTIYEGYCACCSLCSWYVSSKTWFDTCINFMNGGWLQCYACSGVDR